jgi:uracil-DNA glycosylase
VRRAGVVALSGRVFDPAATPLSSRSSKPPAVPPPSLETSPLRARLALLHAAIDGCRACPNMIGPPVHGPPIDSRIVLVGQAPGPREGSFGRPFAWTAGKTMFGWFQEAFGPDEETFRERVYIAAGARCFPGKASGGGDRKPDRDELARCRPFLQGEIETLQPTLVLPVGTLAIAEVLGFTGPLVDIIGTQRRAVFHGVDVEVIALPHPSGASPWPRVEPGKTLLRKALDLLAAHPEIRRAFPTGE